MNFGYTRRLLVIVFGLLFVSGCSLTRDLFAPTLSVAVAPNLRNAFERLSSEFHRGTGITLRPTFAPSDTLAARIERGELFDLFLSSDSTLAVKLFDEHLATTAPEVFAHEQLMLWSTTSENIGRDLGLLLAPSIRRIAIVDSGVDPCGNIAIGLLQRARVYDSLKSKIVFAASKEEVNRYVVSGEVDAGINLASTVRTPLQKNDLVIILGHWQHDPMPQSVVILRHGSDHHSDAVREFVWFLQCDYGQDLLQQCMYQ